MTDLEMTRLCAEAMRIKHITIADGVYPKGWAQNQYDPLHDDAQAMALVKKFELNIGPDVQGDPAEEGWQVDDYTGDEFTAFNANLNRAICECVAKIQAAK